jgi:hypothetical protein
MLIRLGEKHPCCCQQPRCEHYGMRVSSASERRSILRHCKPASVILNWVIENHQTILIIMEIMWGSSDTTGSAVSASAPLTASELMGLVLACIGLCEASLSVLGNGALSSVGQATELHPPNDRRTISPCCTNQ